MSATGCVAPSSSYESREGLGLVAQMANARRSPRQAPHTQQLNITNSQNIQVGEHNTMTVVNHFHYNVHVHPTSNKVQEIVIDLPDTVELPENVTIKVSVVGVGDRTKEAIETRMLERLSHRSYLTRLYDMTLRWSREYFSRFAGSIMRLFKVKKGSIEIVLACNDKKSVEELKQHIRKGMLTEEIKDLLLTDDIKKLAKGANVDLKIEIVGDKAVPAVSKPQKLPSKSSSPRSASEIKLMDRLSDIKGIIKWLCTNEKSLKVKKPTSAQFAAMTAGVAGALAGGGAGLVGLSATAAGAATGGGMAAGMAASAGMAAPAAMASVVGTATLGIGAGAVTLVAAPAVLLGLTAAAVAGGFSYFRNRGKIDTVDVEDILKDLPRVKMDILYKRMDEAIGKSSKEIDYNQCRDALEDFIIKDLSLELSQ